jgi:ubiquinone/menaquinone biosynthesis C-methylase UbiE
MVESFANCPHFLCMSFDILAPHYHWMERFLAQGKLQRCRLHGLEAALGAERLLLVGEGHGRFLELLGSQEYSGSVTCVDASAGMLEVAMRKAWQSGLTEGQVDFVQADVLEWEPPEESFDFVATHFFLDCFDEVELERVVRKLGRAIETGGSWHVADFSCPDKGWRRLRAEVILWVMYMFFRPVTGLSATKLVDPDNLFSQSALTKVSSMEAEWGLLRSTLWRK